MSSACRTTTLLSSTFQGKTTNRMRYRDNQTMTKERKTTQPSQYSHWNYSYNPLPLPASFLKQEHCHLLMNVSTATNKHSKTY